jgi:hypothetical protein
MTNAPPTPEPASTVLIFGPQALSFRQESFAKLRNHIQEPGYQWLFDAVCGLSGFWSAISNGVPVLRPLDGQTRLEELAIGLQTGDLGKFKFPLPNILLSPLVVITHLTEYLAFIKAEMPDLADTQSFPPELLERTEVLGLCTGILTGIAVNCSSSLAQLQNHGTNAIRLAMLAGALVDAEQTSSDSEDSTSFSVSWSGTETLTSIDDLLSEFPQVISALTVAIDIKNSQLYPRLMNLFLWTRKDQQ